MAALYRLASWASRLLFVLASIAVVAMMLHVTADIAGRLLFNHPLTGTLEIVASYYMVACAYLPLSYVQLQRNHMVIELFTQNLGARARLGLDLFAGALGTLFLGLMAWQTGLVALEKTAIGEAVQATFFEIPVWPSRWMIVVAAGVTTAVLMLQLLTDGRRLISPASDEQSISPHGLL
ncbi:TRAP transporter small permease [Alloalcanivorax mobilis]|uniref:TRAP transporter small permease n=1 Tax=Alloalcanivorax mobilis TaxID=2019569 RepID=UPI000B5B225D|nr:TRAP transporter small permease [Alloalcanivorax mobilis]ASK34210.1 C4-dicarboxylate ABC transporter permease [Alcanivorax sp. N3-2A]|tara:strand:- start:18532 stop:19068 length:537 start_codon:yes stop_codon:yes gene_type:complete